MADSSGMGYERGSLVFSFGILLIAAAYFCTRFSRTLLFWMAFILTRPLGATLGDLLTKPLDHGGMNLDRIQSSLVIATFMIICIMLTQKKNRHTH